MTNKQLELFNFKLSDQPLVKTVYNTIKVFEEKTSFFLVVGNDDISPNIK